MTKAMQGDDIVRVIAQSPWFEDLPGDAHRHLAEFARVRSYQKRSCLYTTGEMGSDVYCILEGRIRLLLTSALGQEYAVRDLEPDAWLGEQFLVGDHPTALNARAVKDTVVLAIPRSIVLEIGNGHPSIYRKLFETTLGRSRGLFILLQGMAFYPLRSRLAGWLINLVEQHGKKAEGGTCVDIRLSQKDLAQLSLGSRQRVNKILGEWRQAGVIEIRANRYLVRDMAALQREMELKDSRD